MCKVAIEWVSCAGSFDEEDLARFLQFAHFAHLYEENKFKIKKILRKINK